MKDTGILACAVLFVAIRLFDGLHLNLFVSALGQNLPLDKEREHDRNNLFP